jgi:hypothetical protein
MGCVQSVTVYLTPPPDCFMLAAVIPDEVYDDVFEDYF